MIMAHISVSNHFKRQEKSASSDERSGSLRGLTHTDTHARTHTNRPPPKKGRSQNYSKIQIKAVVSLTKRMRMCSRRCLTSGKCRD